MSYLWTNIIIRYHHIQTCDIDSQLETFLFVIL